ncbi:unnamed protein product, partial [Leptidea sinapis]
MMTMHRRKMRKKLLHQMEIETARRDIQIALEDHQRARLSARVHVPLRRPSSDTERGARGPERLISPALASALAHALLDHLVTLDATHAADHLLLCAKVVGRLCALTGGCCPVDTGSLLALARRADLVEYESDDSSPTTEDCGMSGRGAAAAVSRRRGVAQDLSGYLIQLIESDDSEPEEKVEQNFLDSIKIMSRKKSTVDVTNSSIISACLDARLESGGAAAAEAAARRLLARTALALPAALRAPPHRPAPPAPPAGSA